MGIMEKKMETTILGFYIYPINPSATFVGSKSLRLGKPRHQMTQPAASYKCSCLPARLAPANPPQSEHQELLQKTDNAFCNAPGYEAPQPVAM